MGKYLTEFSSNTAYNAALATLDFPNVSLVANQLKYAESLPTMYRWVDDGGNTICGDGDLEDGCTLFQRIKKQKSVDGGQTWSDVIPREYGYGDIIEEDSSECGCGEEEDEQIYATEYSGQIVKTMCLDFENFENDGYALEDLDLTFYLWVDDECRGYIRFKGFCVADCEEESPAWSYNAEYYDYAYEGVLYTVEEPDCSNSKFELCGKVLFGEDGSISSSRYNPNSRNFSSIASYIELEVNNTIGCN